MGCLDDETALAFFEHALCAEEAVKINAHADQCSACRTLIANLARVWTAAAATAMTTSADVQPEAAAAPFIVAGTALGRYIVGDCIGEGGMGQVYRAYDPDLDRTVALKLLRPSMLPADESEPARARLTREAKAMARISHPNVLPVYDVCVEGGRVFFAMELIAGTTLRGFAGARPDWRATVNAYISAGRGLVAAHQRGIVHRDFKPDNVLVGADGRVLVTDFGIARSEANGVTGISGTPTDLRTLSAVTRTGSVVGTPAYMAPEQRAAQSATAKSDQYSFCVALTEALTGHRPQSPADVDIDVTGGLPAPVLIALRKGLSQSPETRHASMDALLELLTSACAPASTAVPRQGRLLAFGALAAAAVIGSFGVFVYATLQSTTASAGQDAGRGAASSIAPPVIARSGASGSEMVIAAAGATLTGPMSAVLASQTSNGRTLQGAPATEGLGFQRNVHVVSTTERRPRATVVPSIASVQSAATASVHSNEDL